MIKLSVSELREQASKVDTEKENLSTVLSSLDTITEFLSTEWAGNASAKFQGQYNDQLKPAVQNMIEALGDLSQNIRINATNFEEADAA